MWSVLLICYSFLIKSLRILLQEKCHRWILSIRFRDDIVANINEGHFIPDSWFMCINGDKPVNFFTWWMPPHTFNSVPFQNGTTLHVSQAVFTQVQFGHPGIVLWIRALIPYFNFKFPYFNVFCTLNMRQTLQVIFLNRTERYTYLIMRINGNWEMWLGHLQMVRWRWKWSKENGRLRLEKNS